MRTLAILVVLVVAGGSAHADGKPQISVAIASSHDESPGARDAAAREANRETIKQALLASLKSSSQLTSVAQAGVEARRVDLTVVVLDVTEGARGMQLRAELKIVISDATGKILSIVTGGAKSQVSRRAWGTRPHAIEKQLLEDAMQGMFGPLRTHLLRTASNC